MTDPVTTGAPLREVVELIGRHAVRLSCGHVAALFVGEAEALGRQLPCERCAVADLGTP